MPRPYCRRRVFGVPGASVFKPAGVRARDLDEIVVTLDEFEAIRLADLEGLYQETAASRMGVSRPTFGRVLEAAHRKVADALVRGKALRIEGGPIHSTGHQRLRCLDCLHAWKASIGASRRAECPRCGGVRIQGNEGADNDRRGAVRGRCRRSRLGKK